MCGVLLLPKPSFPDSISAKARRTSQPIRTPLSTIAPIAQAELIMTDQNERYSSRVCGCTDLNQRVYQSAGLLRITGKCISKVIRLTVLLTILSLTIPQAVAFKGLILSHSAKILRDARIEKLSELSNETGGVKKIGDLLGKENLPNDVLEDTYLRIAVRKETISREEARGMFSRLSGVGGFRPTLRKMIGNNSSVTKGHLNELKIADEAHQLGFKVRKINEPFRDGMKGGWTDIDITLEKNGKIFAVEAKSYNPGTEIPMSDFRRDLNTLVAYTNRSPQPENVVPILSMTSKPANPKTLRMLKREARERNIELIFGDPKNQALQFEQLGAIL